MDARLGGILLESGNTTQIIYATKETAELSPEENDEANFPRKATDADHTLSHFIACQDGPSRGFFLLVSSFPTNALSA